VSVAAGASLVLATFLDIVLTVLHAQKESRISGAFNRVVWAGLRAVARVAPPRKRHAVLSWAIPMMIGGLLGLWLVTLLVGYALIYLPWIGSRRHFLLGDTPGHTLADALYFSGASLATVGYGDLTPITAPFRFLGVLQGLSGIVVVSLSITYLLTLYPSLSLKNALAETLNRETDGSPDALLMVERYLRVGKFDALANRLTTINEQLLAIAEAHRFHSVLYYSHPVDVERSLVRLLLVVRGLLTTIQFGLYHPDAGRDTAYWEDPRVRTLENSFIYTLRTLANSIQVNVAEEIKDDEENRALLLREYARVRGELCDRGLVPEEGQGAAEEFVAFRIRSDNYINAYRKHSGYSTEEIERELRPPMW
jgi:hypothetical protein